MKKATLLFGILVSFVTTAHAQTFTGSAGSYDGGTDYDYGTGADWSGSAVPVTSNGGVALIANGESVTYNPGGDILISNGGELEISSGSWTQINGNNWIQLGAQGSGASTGNGTILVNGGTFNQGTDSAQPFNLTGTGNLFQVMSGTANFTGNFNVNAGLTYSQSGGTVNVTNGEFDFNTTTITLSGGNLNTKLITGVNAGGTAIFNLSGAI